jgi:hypothetical protein
MTLIGALLLLMIGREALAADRLPSPPAGYRWESVPELSDEFKGGKLDGSKWTPHHPYWKGREPSQFVEENVSVRDGNLELRSTTGLKDLSQVKDPWRDIWVQSACVSSKTPIASYGFYEARIKASQLSMTSSFWFQGEYSEIDVVEQIGAPILAPQRSQYMLMNTHYFTGSPKQNQATPAKSKMSSGAAEQFHVYGVWWQNQDSVVFYLDGKEVARVSPRGKFLEPMYMFFDTEVFKDAGLPGIDSLKDDHRNVMHVDWVHSWRLVGVK